MFPLGRRVTGKQEKMSNNCWFKRFPPIPGNLHSISLLAQSRTIDDEFIHIINTQQVGHQQVIDGSNGAGPASDLFSGKIEVLADVSGIEMDRPVYPLGIPQLRS
jgi:hypothetical protein